MNMNQEFMEIQLNQHMCWKKNISITPCDIIWIYLINACVYEWWIFVSPLDITDLVNKIKININLIIIIISFCSSLKVLPEYVIIFGNTTWIHIFIIARRKVMRIFMFSCIHKSHDYLYLKLNRKKKILKIFFSIL